MPPMPPIESEGLSCCGYNCNLHTQTQSNQYLRFEELNYDKLDTMQDLEMSAPSHEYMASPYHEFRALLIESWTHG